MMDGGGDHISSAQVSINNITTDGELELSAESTIPQHKPLRGKWSKIPIRLGSSLSNVAMDESSSHSHTSSNGGETTKQLASKDQVNGCTAPLTTIKHSNDTSPTSLAHTSSHTTHNTTHSEEKSTKDGEVDSVNTEPYISTTDNNVNGNETTRERSGSTGSVGLSKSPRNSRSSSKTTISTKTTTSHSSHKTLSDATIAHNADALAYFPDDMIEVDLIGVKHEQRVGHPLHICAKCDLPIAAYGRLMPCQHIFCVSCAEKCFVDSKPAKPCYTCKQTPKKIEHHHDTASMFLCLHGKCKRGYLSEFALTEHQCLRNHLPPSSSPAPSSVPSPSPSPAQSPTVTKASPTTTTHTSSTNEKKRKYNDGTRHHQHHSQHKQHFISTHSSSSHSHPLHYYPSSSHYPSHSTSGTTRHYSPPMRHSAGGSSMDYAHQNPIQTYYKGSEIKQFDRSGRPPPPPRPMRPVDPYARGSGVSGSGGSWTSQRPPGTFYPYY